MKLSFSECSLINSVKNGDLGSITYQIEELSKSVQTFLQNQIKSEINFRQQLYTFTFSYIIQTLQGQQMQIDVGIQNNIIIEIIQAIREFKIELFDLAAQHPNMPLFDYLVTQQFNDLYDVLTASEKQLNGQLEPTTPKKKQQSFRQNNYLFGGNETIKKRALSAGHSSNQKMLQQNAIEVEFAMLQQFAYNQITKPESPKTKDRQNPQLFSFDSTLVRDLPFSKYNAVCNFDEQFNFTLQKNQDDAIQTSRFESQRIDEEEYFATDQSSTDLTLDRSYREWDARFRLLAEKEKQVAQRELKTIIQEKHLLNRSRRQLSPNSKEQDYDLMNVDGKSTLKLKEFKKNCAFVN